MITFLTCYGTETKTKKIQNAVISVKENNADLIRKTILEHHNIVNTKDKLKLEKIIIIMLHKLD